MSVLVPAALGAAASAVLLRRPGSALRLRGLTAPARAAPGRRAPGDVRGGVPGGVRGPASAEPRRVLGPRTACVVAAAGIVVLVGGPVGLVLAAAVALAGPGLLGRLEPRADRRRSEQLARDLPLALDLLAACLTGGASLADAVRAVAGAVPGPCCTRLEQVAAALAVGSPAAEAWQALGAGDPVGASAARALARSGDGGAPVAQAVCRVAAEARAEALARGTRAARRAGVLAVAPLGLCFLPAFVLLGVVPAVVGLATPLLSTLR